VSRRREHPARTDLRPSAWREGVGSLKHWLCLPEIGEKTLAGWKFPEALPRHLAVAIMGTRLTDVDHSRIVHT
jgi:ATP-dependent helicase Lhr and Lhr-like helicase